MISAGAAHARLMQGEETNRTWDKDARRLCWIMLMSKKQQKVSNEARRTGKRKEKRGKRKK